MPLEYFNKIKDKLNKCWCKETCQSSNKNRWNAKEPYIGQDIVTALLLNTEENLDVYSVLVEGQRHFYNMDSDFHVVDLTKEQYSRIDYSKGRKRDVKKLLTNPNIRQRYFLLKDRYEQVLEKDTLTEEGGDNMIEDIITEDVDKDVAKEILLSIKSMSTLYDEDGEEIPSYCFLSDLTEGSAYSEEDVLAVAKANGYKLYKIAEGKGFKSGIVIFNHDSVLDMIKNDYQNFFEETPEMELIEEVNEGYEYWLLNDLVDKYLFDYNPSIHERIWQEIFDEYGDEDLANDVLAALEDDALNGFYMTESNKARWQTKADLFADLKENMITVTKHYHYDSVSNFHPVFDKEELDWYRLNGWIVNRSIVLPIGLLLQFEKWTNPGGVGYVYFNVLNCKDDSNWLAINSDNIWDFLENYTDFFSKNFKHTISEGKNELEDRAKKHKKINKRKNSYTYNPDAGNVEKNVEFFNHVANGSSEVCCESNSIITEDPDIFGIETDAEIDAIADEMKKAAREKRFKIIDKDILSHTHNSELMDIVAYGKTLKDKKQRIINYIMRYVQGVRDGKIDSVTSFDEYKNKPLDRSMVEKFADYFLDMYKDRREIKFYRVDSRDGFITYFDASNREICYFDKDLDPEKEVYVKEAQPLKGGINETLAPSDYKPNKVGKAYKVFKVKNGKLYPPMVANPGGESTPLGVWLFADEGESAGVSKTGRPQVKSTGSGTLAYRPGWHLGDIPLATQFYRTNKETGEKEFPKDFVWAECEYAMDNDYQADADEQGHMRYDKDGKEYRSDKYQHSLAGLKRLPKDGYYRYRTNPNPDTVPWVITGAMKVTKLLSDIEVAEILKQHGIDAPNRQGGNKTLKELGLNESYEEVNEEYPLDELYQEMLSITKNVGKEFTHNKDVELELLQLRRFIKDASRFRIHCTLYKKHKEVVTKVFNALCEYMNSLGVNYTLGNEYYKDNFSEITFKVETPIILKHIKKDICDKCENELTDSGECPLCDLGDQTVLEEDNKNKKEYIDLYYDNLPITIVTKKGNPSGYYSQSWGQWYPDEDETAEITISYEYSADKADVMEVIYWNLTDEDISNVDELEYDDVKKFIEDNFEALFEKYLTKIEDYFKDLARDEAEANYEDSDYYEEGINEAIEKHDTLNPALWTEDKVLKQEVADKIVEIVDTFIEKLEEDEIKVSLKDIVLVGSNANYNYTKDSDLDVHIITDSSVEDCPVDLLGTLYNAYKSLFNDKYNITINGVNVELYVETDDLKATSNGIYSLSTGWVKEPEWTEIPEVNIETEFKAKEEEYNKLIENPSLIDIVMFIDNLYKDRQEGIASEDKEYSKGNLVFKEFRNSGYLDNLKQLRDEIQGKELSL